MALPAEGHQSVHQAVRAPNLVLQSFIECVLSAAHHDVWWTGSETAQHRQRSTLSLLLVLVGMLVNLGKRS